MKKLLTFIALLISLSGFSQIHWNKIFSYNEYLGLHADSALIFPGDTLASAPILSLAIKNNHVYQKLSTGIWSQVDGGGNAVQSLTGSQSIQYGPFNSMPSPGTAGRYYAATDSARWYFDNGTAWVNLSGSGGGGGGTGANPTASIGLTPVNGIASTFMRSDAAPPLATQPAMTIIGNNTAGVATPAYLTVAQIISMLNLGTAAFVNVPASGNASSSQAVLGNDTRLLGTNNVTNSNLAQMTANGFKGNNTGGTANVQDLTPTQAATLLASYFVQNAGASKSLQSGVLASRPAASNCQCFYFSTDSVWLSYDNGSWNNLKGGSGGGGPDSAVVTVSRAVSKLVSGTTIQLGGNGIYFYPEDYGAIPNGIFDCHTAIQNCYNAAGAAGGGNVFFGQGKYLSSDSINVPPYVNTMGISGNNLTGRAIGGNSVPDSFLMKSATMIVFTNPSHKGFVCGNDSGSLSPWKTGYNFWNIRIHYGGSSTPTAGCVGIYFGDGGNFTCDKITIDSFYDDLYSKVACFSYVTNSVFYSPVHCGYIATNTFFGDDMDVNLVNCFFMSGRDYPRPYAGFYSKSPGGIKLTQIKANPAKSTDSSKYFRYDIAMDNSDGVSQDDYITNSSFEGFDTSAIYWSFNGSQHQRLGAIIGIETYTDYQAIAPAIQLLCTTPNTAGAGHFQIDNIVCANTLGGLNTSFPAVLISGLTGMHVGKIDALFYNATAPYWGASNINFGLSSTDIYYTPEFPYAGVDTLFMPSPGAVIIASDGNVASGGSDRLSLRAGGYNQLQEGLGINATTKSVYVNNGATAFNTNNQLEVNGNANSQRNISIVNRNSGTGAWASYTMDVGGSFVSELMMPGSNNGGFGLIGSLGAGGGESGWMTNGAALDFYNYSGTGTIRWSCKASGAEGMRLSSNNNFLVGTATDNTTANIQSLSTSQPQIALHYDASHYAGFQVNSAGSLGWQHLTGWTLPGAAIPTGSTSDSVLVSRTSAFTGIDTIMKVAQSSIGSGASFYQTVQSNGTSQTQRAKLNIKSGATVADNSGNGSTDVTITPVIFAQTNAGTAITSSQASLFTGSTNTGSLTIPANTLQVGQTISIHGRAQYSTAASPGSLSFNPQIGGTGYSMLFTPAGSISSQYIDYTFEWMVVTTGSSGTVMGTYTILVNGSNAIVGSITSTLTINTTSSVVLDLQAVWSGFVSGDSINGWVGNIKIQ